MESDSRDLSSALDSEGHVDGEGDDGERPERGVDDVGEMEVCLLALYLAVASFCPFRRRKFRL